jgi:hypothetical protein
LSIAFLLCVQLLPAFEAIGRLQWACRGIRRGTDGHSRDESTLKNLRSESRQLPSSAHWQRVGDGTRIAPPSSQGDHTMYYGIGGTILIVLLVLFFLGRL